MGSIKKTYTIYTYIDFINWNKRINYAKIAKGSRIIRIIRRKLWKSQREI